MDEIQNALQWALQWLRFETLPVWVSLLGAAVTAAFGALLVFIWRSSALRRVESELAASGARESERAQRIEALAKELDARDAALAESREGLSEAEQHSTRLSEELRTERTLAAEKLALLERAEKEFSDAFGVLSAEALRKNNESFLQLAKSSLEKHQQEAAASLEQRREAIDRLVKPITASLEKVEGQVREVEKQRVAAYEQISAQVRTMADGQLQLRGETERLVNALRQPHVRGQWGELQLKRVVEMAGMLEHCDFETQTSTTSDDGVLRPDMLVRLPAGKQIIVDAKAPLSAYLEAAGTEDEEKRRLHLEQHARQVREHMNALSSKAYWSQFPNAPEFVIMFLPGEAFFGAALECDPSLIEHGVRQRVIPASPTTLIALLRAVSYGWRQETLAENAQKISELGRLLHERIATLAGHFQKMGRSLGGAVDSYNNAMGSLERRVLPKAREFNELGAATEKIPRIDPLDQTARSAQAPELLSGEDSDEE